MYTSRSLILAYHTSHLDLSPAMLAIRAWVAPPCYEAAQPKNIYDERLYGCACIQRSRKNEICQTILATLSKRLVRLKLTILLIPLRALAESIPLAGPGAQKARDQDICRYLWCRIRAIEQYYRRLSVSRPTPKSD